MLLLGHAIYQLIILLTLVFAGDEIFDIRSGRRPDLTEDERDDDLTTQHYTIVFNTFVWLQIFNEINARVIDDDLTCDNDGCVLPGETLNRACACGCLPLMAGGATGGFREQAPWPRWHAPFVGSSEIRSL
jgi:hypothetical protein